MANTKMGAKKSFYGIITAEPVGFLPTYEAWTELGQGGVAHPHTFSEVVAVNENLSTSEAKMNCNDRQAEYVKEVNAIDLTFENKGLTDSIEIATFGHTLTQGVISRKESDAAPYIGFGFVNVLIDNGVKSYQAVFYPKCKAVLGNNAYNTKGDNITFSGDTITLHAVACNTGAYKVTKIFDTESGAIGYIADLLMYGGFTAYTVGDNLVHIKVTLEGISPQNYYQQKHGYAFRYDATASVIDGVLTIVQGTGGNQIKYELTLADAEREEIPYIYKVNGAEIDSSFTATYTNENVWIEVIADED